MVIQTPVMWGGAGSVEAVNTAPLTRIVTSDLIDLSEILRAGESMLQISIAAGATHEESQANVTLLICDRSGTEYETSATDDHVLDTWNLGIVQGTTRIYWRPLTFSTTVTGGTWSRIARNLELPFLKMYFVNQDVIDDPGSALTVTAVVHSRR